MVNTPEEALSQFAASYEAYRLVATLSFSLRKKRLMLTEISHSLSECVRVVNAARSAGHDDNATQWRKIQEFLSAQQEEIKMWIFLAQKNFHAAWEALVRAQGAAHWAARWLPNFDPAQQLEEQLALIERVVFPKQQFFSPSMIIAEDDIECTVCHSRGSQCDHIAGEIYAGEVACRIIHNLKGLREISLVDNPANKYARAISYKDMDLLTGEPMKQAGKKQKQ